MCFKKLFTHKKKEEKEVDATMRSSEHRRRTKTINVARWCENTADSEVQPHNWRSKIRDRTSKSSWNILKMRTTPFSKPTRNVCPLRSTFYLKTMDNARNEGDKNPKKIYRREGESNAKRDRGRLKESKKGKAEKKKRETLEIRYSYQSRPESIRCRRVEYFTAKNFFRSVI